MVYKPQDKPFEWDKYGGWIFALLGLLYISTISGCAYGKCRREQIEKDMNIVDFKLSELRHQVVAPLDKTFVDNARWQIRKKLSGQYAD